MPTWKVTYALNEPVTVEVEAPTHGKAVRIAMADVTEKEAVVISALEVKPEELAEEAAQIIDSTIVENDATVVEDDAKEEVEVEDQPTTKKGGKGKAK